MTESAVKGLQEVDPWLSELIKPSAAGKKPPVALRHQERHSVRFPVSIDCLFTIGLLR